MFRDLTGYRCGFPDYRDGQHILIERVNEDLKRLASDLSQFHNESLRTLVVLDSHARTLGRLMGDRLGGGNGGNLLSLLDIEEDISTEQGRILALYFMRDVRSLVTRLQLALSSFDEAFKVMSLFEIPANTYTLPVGELLRTLAIRCHVLRAGLMGQT